MLDSYFEYNFKDSLDFSQKVDEHYLIDLFTVP